jgi:hypothetical protein
MPRLINIDMLKNPLNWATILLMLVIFGFFVNVIAGHYGHVKSTAAVTTNG